VEVKGNVQEEKRWQGGIWKV